MFDNDGNLVVGGEFKYAGGVQVNNIARWNGSAWSAFGTAGAEQGLPWDLPMGSAPSASPPQAM